MAMCLINPTFAIDARLVSMAASAENLSAKRKDQHVSLSENEPIVGPRLPTHYFGRMVYVGGVADNVLSIWHVVKSFLTLRPARDPNYFKFV